jgi:eukaryotic-like serine/threonine-protein kinase
VTGGPDLALGTVLDGIYRIDRLLGKGGMGSVYQATQTRLDKRVAIKVMSRDLTGNPEALLRFRREAQVTSQLGHPHIVHVFDFGTTPEDAPFMAMELLEGEDLETRLQRVRRLPPAAVAGIVKQVASALAATHVRGIVHRDLKPANIFLLRLEGSADFVKVVDFGVSKVRSAAGRLTRPTMLMGSPQFMSPEQAAGQVDAIDHRTDQWALACIAFEALTGRAPFVADDVNALLYQVTHNAPPSLTALAPELPAQLEAVLARALAKPPGERFENIGMFAAAFERAASAGGHRMKPEDSVAGDTGPFRTLEDGAPAVDWAAEPPLPVAEAPAAATAGPRGTIALLVTTFSRTVGELTLPGAAAARRPRARTLIWLAAGGVCLLLLALLMFNPRGAQTASTNTPRKTAAGEPARPPVPAPPLPPAPAAAPAGPVIERVNRAKSAKPARSQPAATHRAPATRSSPSRRKSKLFEDL